MTFVVGTGGPPTETSDGRSKPTPENRGRLSLVVLDRGALRPATVIWLANSCELAKTYDVTDHGQMKVACSIARTYWGQEKQYSISKFSPVAGSVTHCLGFTHLPTDHFFHFFTTHALGALYIGGEWSPPFNDGSVREQVNDREQQIDLCDDWLRVVKREYEAEDLWASLQRHLPIHCRGFGAAHKEGLEEYLRQ